MPLTKNSSGDFVLSPRKAGLEANAGVAFAPDLNGDSSMLGFDGMVEGTSGGLLTYAIYTAVLSFLDTEAAVKQGYLTRAEQREFVLDKTWEAIKGAVPTVIILSCVLMVFPFLGLPAAVAGLVGAGFMATRITRAAFDAMTAEQRETLTRKAKEVGVNIKGLGDDTAPEATPA